MAGKKQIVREVQEIRSESRPATRPAGDDGPVVRPSGGGAPVPDMVRADRGHGRLSGRSRGRGGAAGGPEAGARPG